MSASKFYILTSGRAIGLGVPVLGAVLLLGGCAPRPPADTPSIETSISPLLPDSRIAISDTGYITVVKTGCPEEPRRTERRQRIVDLAVSQWRRFGYPVVNRSSRFSSLTDVQLQNLVVREVPILRATPTAELVGTTESDSQVEGAIAGYWSVVDPLPAKTGNPAPHSFLADRNAQASANRQWREPWSAAFVSWVLCEAGADDIAFPKSSSHVQFLIDAQDMEKSRLGWYRSLPPSTPVPIAAGDLICSARGVVDEHKIAGKIDPSMPAHCDIVVGADPAQDIVFGIGGNVRDKVALSIISIRTTPKGVILQPNMNTSVPMPWLRILRLKTPSTPATFANSFHLERWSQSYR